MKHPKINTADIDRSQLVEPMLSPAERAEYERGWGLFNRGEFWHAHEAWENVWKNRPEPSRIFFQGIIQLAAAYHLLVVKGRHGGAMKNFEKAEEKLRLFPERFLSVSVASLRMAIREARLEVEKLGADNLAAFDRGLIPQIDLDLL